MGMGMALKGDSVGGRCTQTSRKDVEKQQRIAWAEANLHPNGEVGDTGVRNPKLTGSGKKMTTEEQFRAEQLEVSRGTLQSKVNDRELEKLALQLDSLEKEFKMVMVPFFFYLFMAFGLINFSISNRRKR